MFPKWEPHPFPFGNLCLILIFLASQDPLQVMLVSESLIVKSWFEWCDHTSPISPTNTYLAYLTYFVIIAKKVKIVKEVISCDVSPVAMFSSPVFLASQDALEMMLVTHSLIVSTDLTVVTLISERSDILWRFACGDVLKLNPKFPIDGHVSKFLGN